MKLQHYISTVLPVSGSQPLDYAHNRRSHEVFIFVLFSVFHSTEETTTKCTPFDALNATANSLHQYNPKIEDEKISKTKTKSNLPKSPV